MGTVNIDIEPEFAAANNLVEASLPMRTGDSELEEFEQSESSKDIHSLESGPVHLSSFEVAFEIPVLGARDVIENKSFQRGLSQVSDSFEPLSRQGLGRNAV